MHFLSYPDSKRDTKEIKKIIDDGNMVFLLIFMEGCGPCNATRPQWANIKNMVARSQSDENNIYVIDVNKDYVDPISDTIGPIEGFPTMKFISNRGNILESYEDSKLPDSEKDRSAKSFVAWIKSHTNLANESSPRGLASRLMRKNKSSSLSRKRSQRLMSKRRRNKSKKNRRTRGNTRFTRRNRA